MAGKSFTLTNQLVGGRIAVDRTLQITSNLSFNRPLRISASFAVSERRSRVVIQPASLYDVLGIQNGASVQEIKSAYRKMARIWHPDVAICGGDDTKSSSDEFIRVRAAYTTLSDPEKRALYDITLSRQQRREARLAASAFPGMDRRRRNWESDQCW